MYALLRVLKIPGVCPYGKAFSAHRKDEDCVRVVNDGACNVPRDTWTEIRNRRVSRVAVRTEKFVTVVEHAVPTCRGGYVVRTFIKSTILSSAGALDVHGKAVKSLHSEILR
jgi:hypothetical protein